MVVTTKLFGLALAPLYAAIAQVESDRGATSANVYQLRTLYIADVNRITRDWNRNANASGETPFPIFTAADRTNRGKSRWMMSLYWSYYGRVYAARTGKPVTYEVLARIHNGGPYGWRKPSTKRYWQKVKAAMEKISDRPSTSRQIWSKRKQRRKEDEVHQVECSRCRTDEVRRVQG